MSGDHQRAPSSRQPARALAFGNSSGHTLGSIESDLQRGWYHGNNSPGMLGGTNKLLCRNKKSKENVLYSPDRQTYVASSSLLINTYSRASNILKISPRTDSTQRGNKWKEGSGKGAKGQYSDWKEDVENRQEWSLLINKYSRASNILTIAPRTDSIQRGNKWKEVSGKVAKGQYSDWEEDVENRQEWDSKMRNTYSSPPVKKLELGQGQVKLGQISNKLRGGDTNIDLTMAPSPPKVLTPHMIGFQNDGNTCYFNASLQALLGLPMLVTDPTNLKYAVDRKVAGKCSENGMSGSEKQVKLVIPFLQIARVVSVDEFVKKQKYLLGLEREAADFNIRTNVSVENLKISEIRDGQFGRAEVEFIGRGKVQQLPSHNISSGECILLTESGASPTVDQLEIPGIVLSVSPRSMSISFQENEDCLRDILNKKAFYDLVKFEDDRNFEKLASALEGLRKKTVSKHQLQQMLFGLRSPTLEGKSFPPSIMNKKTGKIKFYNNSLNKSQKDAVEFALGQNEVAVVHGPPGTGKTTTLAEIITQTVRCEEKVLVCAPSNIAVDNLMEKLVKNGVKVVRLGDPARVQKHLQKYTLDAVCFDKKIRSMVLRLQTLTRKVRKTKIPELRKTYRKEIQQLQKEIKKWERNAFKETLCAADVVLSTLMTGSNGGPLKYIPKTHFKLTVIDECSQSKEMECWLVIHRSPKLLLAGDHKQLPPTILSPKAAQEGLSYTLMERVIDMYGKKVVRMLTTQYRMNNSIMKWSSEQMYDGNLVADKKVINHTLADLSHVIKNEMTSLPLLVIDTRECNMTEHKNKMSKGNHWEAGLVNIHVIRLVNSGVKQEEIAVISPYKLQVELIRQRLYDRFPRVEVKTVDGFQGREKEAVILSLVRSNSKKGVGFLAEKRRLNVAVTRAKRHLSIICNSQTMNSDPFLRDFVNYAKESGKVELATKFTDQLMGMIALQLPANNKKKTNENRMQEINQKMKSMKVSGNNSNIATKCIGLDCEMVGVGDNGAESILARVSLVNQDGQKIYDKYVRPSQRVTDYRTDVSGIRPQDLEGATDFKIVKKEVSALLKGKLLVGHGLKHDIQVLSLIHPSKDIRDTSMYPPFKAKFGGKTPSLKKLASMMLKIEVQSGVHSSVEDAAAAIKLYKLVRNKWEESVKARTTALKKSKVAETIRG